MNFQEAIKYGFKNYANFSGVVGRPAYWNWILFIAVINIPATLGSVLVSGSSEGGLFQLLEVANLALLTPTLALSVRRLRDAGFSPLWLLALSLNLWRFDCSCAFRRYLFTVELGLMGALTLELFIGR